MEFHFETPIKTPANEDELLTLIPNLISEIGKQLFSLEKFNKVV